MTNKPMLSVGRELLARSLVKPLNTAEFKDCMDAIEELRALLDKPLLFPGYPPVPEDRKLPAAQHHCEPVAWLNIATGHVTTSSVVVMDWDDEKEQVQSLYAEQPAPVAHESECTSCDGSGEYTDAIGDWRGYCTCPAGVEAEGLKGLMP